MREQQPLLTPHEDSVGSFISIDGSIPERPRRSPLKAIGYVALLATAIGAGAFQVVAKMRFAEVTTAANERADLERVTKSSVKSSTVPHIVFCLLDDAGWVSLPISFSLPAVCTHCLVPRSPWYLPLWFLERLWVQQLGHPGCFGTFTLPTEPSYTHTHT